MTSSVLGLASSASSICDTRLVFIYGTVIWIHDHLGDALRLWIAIVARKCSAKWARTHAIYGVARAQAQKHDHERPGRLNGSQRYDSCRTSETLRFGRGKMSMYSTSRKEAP